MSDERKINEFNEVSGSIRHYSNLRFALLTLFFAFAGACILFIYGEHPPKQLFAVFATRVAAIGGTIILWSFEWRIQQEFLHLERRAAELERQLGYDIYKWRTQVKIRMFWLTSLFFLAVIVFWCISFFKPPIP